jgi:hypothetical protein
MAVCVCDYTSLCIAVCMCGWVGGVPGVIRVVGTGREDKTDVATFGEGWRWAATAGWGGRRARTAAVAAADLGRLQSVHEPLRNVTRRGADGRFGRADHARARQDVALHRIGEIADPASHPVGVRLQGRPD